MNSIIAYDTIRWLRIKAVILISLAVIFQSAASAQAQSHQSSDLRIVSARILIDDGRNSDALEILRAIEPNHASQIEIGFLIGLAAMGASQEAEKTEEEKSTLLEEAIQALSNILIDHPELVRVRLELARAYFLIQDDRASSAQFKRVLAGVSHPAVIANINRFLRQIRQRRKWRGYLGVAIAPDSNINFSSDEGIIYIHGLPFQLDDFEGAKSGVGINIWGGVDYFHNVGEKMTLIIGGSASILDFRDSAFDRELLSIHFGPKWQLTEKTALTVLLSHRRHWYGGEHQLDEHGFQVITRKQFSRTHNGEVKYSRYNRQYAENQRERNGPFQMLELSATWIVKPTLQSKFSLNYSRNRPQSISLRHSTWSLRGEVLNTLKKGYTLGFGGDVSYTRYQSDPGTNISYTLPGEARRDRTLGLEFSVYNQTINWNGFSPQLKLRREWRKSNASISNFNRTRAEIQFVRPL